MSETLAHDPAPPEPRPDDDAVGKQHDEETPPSPRRRTRRLTAETLLMLVVPPLLVLLVFGGYAWWHEHTHLDSVEAQQLRWKTVWRLLLQHVELTGMSALLVVVIAIPLGIAMTRGPLRRAAPLVVGVANGGQAAPSVGLIVLLAIWLGFGFWTAVLALTLYGVLPVLRNTITGLQGVDPTLVEAGRGVGMSSTAVLLRVEMPLAVPVIMAGLRTALVLIVGTAALATFINAGGLGAIITAGITNYRFRVPVAGAVLIALLALLVEWLGRLLELLARPKGL